MNVANTLIIFSVLSIFQQFDGREKKALFQGEGQQIRVINRSGHNFTRISLFSMAFEDLQAGDTSKYKTLNYNPLEDDPLIYCMAEGKNFARYLQIPKGHIDKFTYIIDSINNDIVYVSTQIDK